jgi:hypothetical protein
MKRLFLFSLLASFLRADIFPVDIRPEGMKGNRIGSIRILDQRELVYAEVGGKHFSEISDLAYLKKRRWLFMISDEGKLFRFRVRFGERINELLPMDAYRIRKKNGKKLKKWQRDAEGMTLDGKQRLFVSFEGKPRVARISYDGRVFGYEKLPAAIASEKMLRRRNKGLEALTWHPVFGLVTAPEYPIRDAPKELQTLYALSGKRWSYRRGREPNSAITGLEVLENGNFLVLERAYSGIDRPWVVTLREVRTDRCRRGVCADRVLARFDSSRGWAVENFEGLAKVGRDRFVMVSDDGDNFFLKTVLVYFEVIGH